MHALCRYDYVKDSWSDYLMGKKGLTKLVPFYSYELFMKPSDIW